MNQSSPISKLPIKLVSAASEGPASEGPASDPASASLSFLFLFDVEAELRSSLSLEILSF